MTNHAKNFERYLDLSNRAFLRALEDPTYPVWVSHAYFVMAKAESLAAQVEALKTEAVPA